MKIASYKLKQIDLVRFVQLFSRDYNFDYKKQTDHMVVMASEQYYYRTNSTQLNMVVAYTDENSLIVDLVGGAGGAGVFNTDLGSEKNFIKVAKKNLDNVCDELNVEMEEIKTVVK